MLKRFAIILAAGFLAASSLATPSGFARAATAVEAPAPDHSFTPAVTIILGLRQSGCKRVPASQWSTIMTVMRGRAMAYAKTYGGGLSQVSRSSPCDLAVTAPGIADITAFAAVLRARGRLIIYGMGTLPAILAGEAFAYKNVVLCDAPRAPMPCVVVRGSEMAASRIAASLDQLGEPVIRFHTRGAGTARLAAYTRSHNGAHLAVVVDGTVITNPTITGAIPNGQGEIDGLPSMDEAHRLAIELGSGGLPVAFDLVALQ